MFNFSSLRSSLAVLLLLCGTLAITFLFTTARAASISELTSQQSIAAAVTAFEEIGSLRRETPINADAITAAYSGALQTLAKKVDTDASLNLDGAILAAIDDARNDNEPGLAAQVMDKGIQHVFVQTIFTHLTAALNEFDSASEAELLAAWDGAVSAFEAVRGTAARDNKVLTADKQSVETGTSPGLDVHIEEALASGRAALSKANPIDDKITVAVERQVVQLSLARAYYIGVLREVEGVVTNLTREPETARVKQKEGEIFYGIIEPFIVSDNSTGNVLIKKQFTENIANVVPDEIVSELSKGFIARVKEDLTANEGSVGSNREQALVTAEGALRYANIFQPDLSLRLGETASTNLNTALNDLKTASSAGSTADASTARQTISGILDNYEDELLLSTYNKTSTIPFVDDAVSAFKSIGTLRKQNPVDPDAISAEYEGELRELTQIVDQLYGTTIDTDVSGAILDIRNNNRIDLAVQVIDKSLQRVMALVIYNRTLLVHDEFDTLSMDQLALEWDRGYSAYQGIIGTMARENKVLNADRSNVETGSDPDLDGDMTAAFIRGRKLITDGGNMGALAVEKDIIVLSAMRGFLIGVLREVEGIVGNRDREVATAEEKQVEGEFFYAIVEGFIAKYNSSGSASIAAQMVGSLGDVVADDVVSDISRGLLGQVNENLTANSQAVGSERDQAMMTAEQVSLYMNAMSPDLKLRLGGLKLATVNNALQDLKEASDFGDVTKAENARATLAAINSEYSSELK